MYAAPTREQPRLGLDARGESKRKGDGMTFNQMLGQPLIYDKAKLEIERPSSRPARARPNASRVAFRFPRRGAVTKVTSSACLGRRDPISSSRPQGDDSFVAKAMLPRGRQITALQ